MTWTRKGTSGNQLTVAFAPCSALIIRSAGGPCTPSQASQDATSSVVSQPLLNEPAVSGAICMTATCHPINIMPTQFLLDVRGPT